MPPFGSISRARLIRGLRALGFEGPYPGGRHAYIDVWLSPIRMKERSVSTCLRVYYARLVLLVKNGDLCRFDNPQKITRIHYSKPKQSSFLGV